MLDRVIDFGERFGVLLVGIAIGLVAFATFAAVRDADVAAVLAGVIPIALAVVVYIVRQQRAEHARERRFVDLNVELRKKEAMVARLAVTDDLTGLPNRRFFLQRLAAEIDRSRRYERPPSIILVDLDRFKQVNDTFGHAAGDLVLRETARLLRDNVRETDVVARYGGEEFALLLVETVLADAVDVAEKLRRAVADRRIVDGPRTYAVTISAGVTELAPVDDADAFLGRADAALYDAKRAGRDRIVSAMARQADAG